MSPVQAVSRQVVLRAIPVGMRRRFDPGAAGELDATFELRVTGGGEQRYAVRIADHRCTVRRGGAPEATAHVRISAGDIARLASGAVRWPELLAGKRLTLTGDPFLALRFPMLFRFGR